MNKINLIKHSLLIGIFLLASNNLNAQNSALSIHLAAKDNFSGDIIMKTLNVPHKTLYTYYCALMWNVGGEGGGYCGMQNHPSGNNFIFSIWDPISSNEPIRSAYTGPGTGVLNFGGEGTGLKSWNFELGWAEGHDYQLVARRWDVDNHSYFGYWVHDISSENWTHLVTMDFPVPGVKFNTTTGSFLEDWSSSGSNMRRVYQKDGYKRKLNGEWAPFDYMHFSINTNDISSGSRSYNYRNNYDAGVENGYYFMQSGGSTSPSFSGNSIELTNNIPAEPVNNPIEFYFTELTDSSVAWTVPQSSTPQFKVTLKIGSDTIIDSILTELNSFTIAANKGDVVRLTIEDLLGNTTTKKAIVGTGNLAPKVPTGIISTVVSSSEFSISWNAVENADTYSIQIKEGEIWKTKGETSSTGFSVSGLKKGSTQKYRLKSVNSYGESAYSVTGEVTLEMNMIPQTGWSLRYVDSEETAGEDGKATNAFDGDESTFWHTEWSGNTPKHPHEIQIDLGAKFHIEGFKYLPRQDGGVNGTIADYEFYVSADGKNWGSAVASGTFASNTDLKQVSFGAVDGKFIKLKALSEINGGAWTSAAEIMLAGFSVVNIDYKKNTNPLEFNLYQNYPNPFNPATIIGFSLPRDGDVKLQIINCLGETLRNLLPNTHLSAGYHEVQFSAEWLPSGIYFYRIQAGKNSRVKKMILQK